jgi:microcystin-dependent protein
LTYQLVLADGRDFLLQIIDLLWMGATSNSKETGGAASITLLANQLPSHSHYIASSQGSIDDWLANYPNRAMSNHNRQTDGDNNYWYHLRPIGDNTQADMGKSSSVGG